ncbi:MAG: hypothetical protein WCB31_00245 [Nitrososphaeraceae archaeon]
MQRTDERKWCPLCLLQGITVQLGARLYKKEELINGELPHDSFDWLEWCDCGHILEDYLN